MAVLLSLGHAILAQNSHTLPLVLPASGAGLEGFVRIVNDSDRFGAVGKTTTGTASTPSLSRLDAKESVNFSSRDLEQGNASKGFPIGVGDGIGKWQLTVTTDRAIEAMSLLMSPAHLTNLSTTTLDSMAGAPVITSGETFTGTLDSRDDVDFFRLDLAGTSIVDLMFDAEADLEIALLNESGAALTNTGTASPARLWATVKRGKYISMPQSGNIRWNNRRLDNG